MPIWARIHHVCAVPTETGRRCQNPWTRLELDVIVSCLTGAGNWIQAFGKGHDNRWVGSQGPNQFWMKLDVLKENVSMVEQKDIPGPLLTPSIFVSLYVVKQTFCLDWEESGLGGVRREEDQVELEKQFRKGGSFPGWGLGWRLERFSTMVPANTGERGYGRQPHQQTLGSWAGRRLNTSPELTAHCTSHMGLQGCASQF